MPTCSAPECTRDAVARGLCDSHYRRHRRGGAEAPLRPYGGQVSIVVRLDPVVVEKLKEHGLGISGAARHVLQSWAEGSFVIKKGRQA